MTTPEEKLKEDILQEIKETKLNCDFNRKYLVNNIIMLFKSAGWLSPEDLANEEEADKVARLIKRGWIPPEEAKGMVKLKEVKKQEPFCGIADGDEED